MYAERTVVVDRPPEAVFEFLADGTRSPQWRKGVRELTLMTRWTDVGAVYRQVIAGPGGREIDCDYLITGFAAPHRLEFVVVAGPARPFGSFRLEAREGGATQVTYRLDAVPRGLRRLLAPLQARGLRREVENLDRLKSVLEQAHSAV